MNEAIELLEKQRKVYYKRGGTGEIGDIKSKISDIERKINELIRMKSEYAKEEIRLSEISTELKLALEEKNRLIKASRLAEEARVRKAYINQYREMKLMLEKEENEKKELEKFFVNGVPVRDEIEEARELSIKASRLKDLSRGRDDDEYIKLREFFASELPDEEFERARAILSSLESKKKEAELVERDIVAIQYDEQKNCNDAKTAEHLIEELHLLKQQEKSNKKWLAYTFFGCTGIIASSILGILTSPILFSLSIVGIILSAIGIKSKPRTKAIKADEKLYERARSYIRGVGYSDGIPNDRLINRLREIQRGLQLTSATNERLTSLLARAEEINSQISELEARACQFISNFKVENRENTTSAINEILRKRDLFLALAKTKNNLIKQAEKESLLADEYRKSFQAFLSRFPTTTSRPFDEISSKLIEYEALFRSCEKMKISMADFAVKHGINSDMTEQTDTTESQLIQKSPEELDLKISALEREKTLVERKIADLGEDIDKIDELSSEKQELIERAELYEKKLGVILKTISFLGEAKDSLTSRYLSKTKSAFDKYISLIDGQSAANFQMNTSFSIMKNERGTLRVAEAYSRGTRDLYALAARLALIDSLYESEQPFIILDDPFAYFDDEKLSKSLSLISRLSEERQIIYLTCTSAREA